MIDQFDLMPREEAFDPFSVVLFKALQVIAFLFFIALLIIDPKADAGKVDSKAEFIITVDWPDNHPDDIDTFVQDPQGQIVWFRRREADFMLLDRDDRGGMNDFVVVNGAKVPTAMRQELITIRGIIAGEYTVNNLSFRGSHRAAGTGDRDGAEAQPQGHHRRQGDDRPLPGRRGEDGGALHPGCQGQRHRDQPHSKIDPADLPELLQGRQGLDQRGDHAMTGPRK